MTYLTFHLVFILPPLALLAALQAPRLFRPGHRRRLAFLCVVAAIALVYTTPWDNYLVWRGVWAYGEGRVVGTLGYVPLEEYLFFILQPFLTGLFYFFLVDRMEPAVLPVASAAPRWVGTALGVVATAGGVYALGRPGGLYLGLILAWSAPVLAGQWAYAGASIWAARRPWLAGVGVSTVYLWVADRVALHLGIWRIAPEATTGLHLAGLPIEEAVFFLVTNLLVVQGLILFLPLQYRS